MSAPESQLGSGGSGGEAQEVYMEAQVVEMVAQVVEMDAQEVDKNAQEGSSARAGQETVSDGKTLEAQEEDAQRKLAEEGADEKLGTQAAESSSRLRRSSRAVARANYVKMENGESQGHEEESQGYVPPNIQSRQAAKTDGNEIAAPPEAVLNRPRRGQRVNYFESQETRSMKSGKQLEIKD